MQWEIVSAKDTLVNVSVLGTGESVSKRLLSVRTLDGKTTDKWLEDFGSFNNHFMIKDLDNVEFSHTLWMEYEMGAYLAREISADPFYSHDSGWMKGDETDNEADEYESFRVSYKDDSLTLVNDLGYMEDGFTLVSTEKVTTSIESVASKWNLSLVVM